MSMAAQRIQHWANSKCGRKSFRRWTTSPLKNENKNRKIHMNTNIINKRTGTAGLASPGSRRALNGDTDRCETSLTMSNGPGAVLDSMLAALSEGKIMEFVERFDDDFK